LVAISAALLSATYSIQLMDVMYHEKATSQSASAFSFLMLGFIGSVLILVYGTLLTAALELKYLNTAAFLTLCINLLLNILLIPIYGPTGAAIATAISQILFGTICYIISFRKFNFRPKIIDILMQIFGIGILIVVIMVGKQYCSSIAVHLTVIFISILIVAFMFKLFQLKDLKSLTRH
jgi:O-antigen/teichoic acid export membrane protein